MKVTLGDCFLDEAATIPCPTDYSNELPTGSCLYGVVNGQCVPAPGYAPGTVLAPGITVSSLPVAASGIGGWLSGNSTAIVAAAAIIGVVLAAGKR